MKTVYLFRINSPQEGDEEARWFVDMKVRSLSLYPIPHPELITSSNESSSIEERDPEIIETRRETTFET